MLQPHDETRHGHRRRRVAAGRRVRLVAVPVDRVVLASCCQDTSFRSERTRVVGAAGSADDAQSSLVYFRDPLHALFESMSGWTGSGLTMGIHEPSLPRQSSGGGRSSSASAASASSS